MSKQIFLDAPNVSRLEKRYINKAIDAGYVSTAGPFVPEFEDRFANYLNVKKAISTQSGTAALHIALYELGIGEKDEVIVPSLTFVATVNPILYVGAEPVFIDVDIKTWNISPEKIAEKITKRTKAIIPVHIYGNPCNMDEIMKIARKYNIYVIEDATESLGASFKGQQTGTFGDFGCFSFNGNKIITTGGGGMVVGNSKKRLDHIKFLVNQARDESKGYFYPEVGFNYRMTNIEAALGLAQLKRLNEFLEKKRRFKAIYQNELKGMKNIHFQEEYERADSSFWLVCVTFAEKVNLKALGRKLSDKGIPTRRVFAPVTEFSPYKKYKRQAYRNSYHIYEKSICLPSSTLNSEDDIYFICFTIKKIIKGI